MTKRIRALKGLWSGLFLLWLGVAVSWGDASLPEKASRHPLIDRVDGGVIPARHEALNGQNYFWIEAEDFVPAEARQGSWKYRRSWTWSPKALPNASMGRSLASPIEKNEATASASISGLRPGRYHLFVRMGAFKPWGAQQVVLTVNGHTFQVAPPAVATHLDRAFVWTRVTSDAPIEVGDSLRLVIAKGGRANSQTIVDGFLLTDDPVFVPPQEFPRRGFFSVLPDEGPGVTAEFWHPAVLGTPIYVCADSSQQFLLNVRNMLPVPQNNFDVILTLPQGVMLEDPSRSRRWVGNSGKWSEPNFIHAAPSTVRFESIESDGKKQNRYTLEYRAPLSPYNPYAKVASLLFVVLTTNSSIEPGKYPITLETRAVAGTWKGDRQHQTLEILPKLDGQQVPGFSWGVDAIYASFLHPDEQTALLKTFASAGVNLWASRTRSTDPDLSARNQEHWKRVRAIPHMRLANWGEFWWPGTPYSDVSRDYLAKHPKAAGIGLSDDRGQSLQGKLICPEYLLRGDDESYIREHAEKTTATMRQNGITEIMEDAEYSSPLSYCFDERCKKRFSEISGIPWVEIKDLSGNEILAKHRDAWVAFRCQQNADVVSKIARAFRAAYPEVRFNVFCGYQSWNVRQRYGIDWPMLLSISDVDGAYVGGGLPGTAEKIEQMRRWVARQGKKFISMANATLSFPKGFDELGYRSQAYLEVRIIHDLLCGSKGIFIWWWGTLDGRCLKAFETGTRLAERFGHLIANGELTHAKAGLTDDFQLLTVRGTEGVLVSLVNPSKSTEDRVLDPESVLQKIPADTPVTDALTGRLASRDAIRERLERVFAEGDVELWFLPAEP